MNLGPFAVPGYYTGDCLSLLAQVPEESIDCVVTSPPYWGLRNYGVDGQIGLEPRPADYVERLVRVFRLVRFILKSTGTCWLNLGDTLNSYVGNRGKSKGLNKNHHDAMPKIPAGAGLSSPDHKNKDLIGIPWLVAFALQADGWYLRADIIWEKPNCMPESVTDRPTRSHEYLFLLTKNDRYFYDHEAIKEPVKYGDHPRNGVPGHVQQAPGQPAQTGISKRRSSGNKERKYGGEDGKRVNDHLGGSIPWTDKNGMRNKRSVWTIATEPSQDEHYAIMPTRLAEPCILAGCPAGGIVLDPFAGTGTTGRVAEDLGRKWLLFDLNQKDAAIAKRKLGQRSLLGGASG
jgi:DNA modification methylase